MDAPTTAPEPAEPRSALRPNRLTSGIVAGGAAVAMVLAGLGIASAQTGGAPPTGRPAATTEETDRKPRLGRRHRHPIANPARVASVIGITSDELKAQLADGRSIATIAGPRTDDVVASLVAEATERIDAAVAAERITAEEAATRKARLEQRFTALVNRTPPTDRNRGDRLGRGAGKASLAVAASTLGTTEEALRSELRSGKSLAAIAGDKTPALVEALVEEAETRLDRAVTAGKLTGEQAAERKANLTERITVAVNAVRPQGDRHRGHRHGPRPAPTGEGAETEASVTT